MNKMSPLIVLLTIATLLRTTTSANPIRLCLCWDGYEPERISGGYECVGKNVYHVMSCNVPQPPECSCTGHNGILKDRTGTWCTIYKRGEEFERWPCENGADWDLFFQEYGL